MLERLTKRDRQKAEYEAEAAVDVTWADPKACDAVADVDFAISRFALVERWTHEQRARNKAENEAIQQRCPRPGCRCMSIAGVSST